MKLCQEYAVNNRSHAKADVKAGHTERAMKVNRARGHDPGSHVPTALTQRRKLGDLQVTFKSTDELDKQPCELGECGRETLIEY